MSLEAVKLRALTAVVTRESEPLPPPPTASASNKLAPKINQMSSNWQNVVYIPITKLYPGQVVSKPYYFPSHIYKYHTKAHTMYLKSVTSHHIYRV
jgi:hypothetical protein